MRSSNNVLGSVKGVGGHRWWQCEDAFAILGTDPIAVLLDDDIDRTAELIAVFGRGLVRLAG